jgi:hypothetical protein
MLGLGLALTTAGRAPVSLSRYLQSGVAPSLVLDPVQRLYAVDPGAWAIRYACGGLRPTLVLDFASGAYGTA